ncbi:MAG TPA: hypothetical protein VHB25_04330 [Gemmatimonadaceae bacterium]|nr:hypothetical protein [Gemmatimonadaceae bacterium]
MHRVVLAATAVMLAACIDTASTSAPLPPTETDIAGQFTLTSANGQALPIFAQSTPAARWTLVADTLVIAASGSWDETATYEIDSLASTGTSTQQGVTTGTWTISNQQINFTTTNGGSATFAGALSKGTLTIVFNDGQFVYTKI